MLKYGGFRPRAVSRWMRTAFSCRYTPSDPKISILDLKSNDFRKKYDFPKNMPDFPETIPASLNFGHRHIFFLYPKKLSYSSRNAYIQKLRLRLLGNASYLLKNLKNT